jgi:hypothetical protein
MITPAARIAFVATLLVPNVAVADEPAPSTISVGGYIEMFYQAHFQDADNRLTNLRGFDNRSRTFTLSNVASDLKAERGPLAARLILQIGHTPATYYVAEPASPGANGANASGSELWKYIQAANVTAKAPHDFVIDIGLFTSPIGPEVVPIKDNWNWSRSNLFFGLPFYHTGVAVSRLLGAGWTGKLHVYNGWNSVVDNNSYPSVAVSAAYGIGNTTAQLLYFGGIERPTGAPEGQPWRHLFDALAQHTLTDELMVAAQVDVGLEPNDLGTSSWYAFAVYTKLALADEVFAAVRGDYFHESVAESGGVRANAIFWPVEWVASATGTIAYHPVDGVSLRLEYRHDHAAADAYFGGDVAIDPVTMTFVPDRDMQDTATLGVVAWF